MSVLTSERLLALLNTKEAILAKCNIVSGGDAVFRPESKGSANIYFELGEKFRTPILAGLESLTEEESFLNRVGRSEKVLSKLRSMAVSSHFAPYITDYLNSLSDWGEGADVKDFCENNAVNDPLVACLMLQDDNHVGCQTAIVRLSNEVVVLAHSEETDDPINAMTVAPACEFKVGGINRFAVTYDKLLPGSATFGATEGFSMACDFLRVKNISDGEGLVNALSWVIWRMGNEASPSVVARLVEEMGPFNDAYAINVVRKVGREVEAYRLTCAGDQYVIDLLPQKPGSRIVQTNIIDPTIISFSPGLARLAPNKDELSEGYWKGYLDRIRRINFLISRFTPKYNGGKSGIEEIQNSVHDLMGVGYYVSGGWGLANEYCVVAANSIISADNRSVVGLNVGPVVRGVSSTDTILTF